MEIGIWGDSITYGECDSEALGWVGRLRKSLLTQTDTSVYNFGVCGDTTEDLLRRFTIEANSIKPDVVVFAIGINDSKYPEGFSQNRVMLDAFAQNVQKLVVQARDYTEKIYIVGLTKVDDAFARESGTRFVNEDIQKYNGILKSFCEAKSVAFIDIFDVLNPATDLHDGLHPNKDGYEKLYMAIGSKLK